MAIYRIFFAGIRWNAFSAAYSVLIGLVQVAILARFLSPSDFAVVALIGTIVNLCMQLQSTGINTAIIQSTNITNHNLSSLFWLNIAFSVFFFFASLIVGWGISIFYKLSTMSNIIFLYSSLLLVQAFSVQYKTILQKKLDFQILSIAEIAGVTAGFIFALVAAINDLGALALIGSYICRSTIEGIVLTRRGITHFKPTFYFNRAEIKPYVQFGKLHIAERIITYFSSQIDLLIIGKLLGVYDLGVYDLFKRVLIRPFQLIGDVFEKTLFPFFSKYQNYPAVHRIFFITLLSNITALVFPAVALLIIFAKPLINIYFGNDFSDYSIIFQLLVLFCLIHTFLNPIDTLLIAKGKIRLWLYMNIIFSIMSFIFLSIGAQFGLLGLLIAYLIANFIFFLTSYFWIILPLIRSNWLQLLIKISSPFFLTIIAIIPVICLIVVWNGSNNILINLAGIIIFGLFYVGLNLIFNHKIIVAIKK